MKRKYGGVTAIELALAIIGVAILVAIIVDLDAQESGPSVVKKTPAVETGGNPTTTYDMSKVITKGSSSWIPLNVDGTPAEYANEIIEVMDVFEKTHPELELINWTVEGRQQVAGIWVHHRKR